MINELGSPDPSRRRASAEGLSSSDERALFQLIKALKDGNAGVQDAAMHSIVSIGGEAAAYMIIPMLREEAYVRNMALIILGELGGTALPYLYPLLNDKDDDVRKFAVDLIAGIGHCGCPEKLRELLREDPNPNVRVSAAKAIGLLGCKEAIADLTEALKDSEWVCFAAIEALVSLNGAGSVEPMVSLLESGSEPVRFEAIQALSGMGTARSMEVLLKHLSNTEIGEFEKSMTVRALLNAGIVPEIGGVYELLMDMLQNGEWDDKILALAGLSRLGDERALYKIVDMAGSLDPSEPDAEDKFHAFRDAVMHFGCSEQLLNLLNGGRLRYRGLAFLIGLFGDMKCLQAVPRLVELLKTDLRDVKRASMNALKDMDDESVAWAAMEAVEEDDAQVRKAAVSALGKIGDSSSSPAIFRLLEQETEGGVLEEAVKAILKIDPATFYSRLKSFGELVRILAGKFSDDGTVLLGLADGESVPVRCSALKRLGQLGGEQAGQKLIQAASDAEPEIRKSAVMAMGDGAAFRKQLLEAIKDEDMWVRLYAVKSLGGSPDAESLEAIKTALTDEGVPVVLSAIDVLARHDFADEAAARTIFETLLTHPEEAVRARAGLELATDEGSCPAGDKECGTGA